MRTFAIAAVAGSAAAYTPLPAYVKSLPFTNLAYQCGSTCSSSVKAQIEDPAFRSDKKEGWHDADGWTPWVSRDDRTGTGDHESFQALNEKHNLCGVNNEFGGFFGPIAVECINAAGQTPSEAGQTATCDLTGLKCLNADNAKCFGADAKCVAANSLTGDSNKENQCNVHATVHGCHWGCLNYAVRFQCEKSWTSVPTTAPTPAPSSAPTSAPSSAPTPAPTPAPQPRGFIESKEDQAAGVTQESQGGLMASKGIEFVPRESLVTNGGFINGNAPWIANLEGTVVTAHNDAGKHSMSVKSSQLGDTPGVFQYLDIDGKNTLAANQKYLVLVKGKGSSTQWAEQWQAKPFVECKVEGKADRQQMLDDDVAGLPPADGTIVARFTPSATASECRAGMLFYGTQPTSEMTLDQFEVRKMFDHEEIVLAHDLADRQNGQIANHDFNHGSAFWGRINEKDEVWNNGKDLVVWNHGRPAGQHTGVQQAGITLDADTQYTFALKGRVDRNGASFGNAVVFVSKTSEDQYGNTKTDDITSTAGAAGLDMRLSVQGSTVVSVDFTTSPEDTSLASVTYNVGARFDGTTPADVEMFLENSKLFKPIDSTKDRGLTSAQEQAYLAELRDLRNQRNIQTCDCNPRIHSSKATKCFAAQSGFAARANVIRVVHRKSMLAPETFENIGADQADSHKCEMIDGSCKCCDCKEGQTHGFDLASLKDGRTFTVRFDRAFTTDAGNVKPGMTGNCRFFEDKWCCSCTNSYLGPLGDKTANRCPYTYGQEFCYAYTGTQNPQGVNFWGRNYHFKEYHRCVTPSMHHNCGEGIQAGVGQDIGHLPYFDNNGEYQNDGFAIVNNAEQVTSSLGTYTLSNDKQSICANTGSPQVGGLHGNQVLAADTCAKLCDEHDGCKAFAYTFSTGTTETKCDFFTQVGDSCLVDASGTNFYLKN
jgi:hypothetical protein